MSWDLSGNTTYGDGVGRIPQMGDSSTLTKDGIFYGCGTTAGIDRNCDGFPNDARITIAKDAIRKMLLAFGDVEWSLAKFHQLHATNQTTGRFSPIGNGTGTNRAENCQYISYGNPQCNTGTTRTGCIADIPMGCRPNGADPIQSWASGNPGAQINYGVDGMTGCGTTYPADLLVGFPGAAPFTSTDNRPAILKWMNNLETGFDSSTTSGNFCNHATTGDCELRPVGGTPLGSLIRTSGEYATTTRNADTMYGSCRQYSIILVTDGAESCSTNPLQRAFELAYPAQAPNTTCTGSNIPMNVDPAVKVYVVGISIVGGEQDSLNNIAKCGGTGNAYFASSEAELSARLSEIVGNSIPVEQCNGKDDDCDGKYDEGIPAGVPGNAAQPGALFCDGEARRSAAQNDQVKERPEYDANFPQSTPLSPAVVCGHVDDTCSHAGFDDDCDGELDEDGNLNTCGTCPGAPEVCDGQDNDCDMITDEVQGSGNPFSVCPVPCTVSVPCGSGIGACVPGVRTCSGGVLSTQCTGGTGPSPEVCDEIDNDCNGIVDDPGVLGRTCNTPWGTTGICIPGTQFCAKTMMGEQEDGDGYHVDSNGNPVCEGQVNPEDREKCDLLDHDCNGNPFTCTNASCTIKPNPEHVGDACGQGVGSCNGTLVCDQNANPPALVCNAPGGSPEVCDNLDNDCDGLTDEGLGSGGACGSSTGECRPGMLMCDSNGQLTCTGDTGPVDEVCDALDNDCDGKVDEGLALGEKCGTDEGKCQSGKFACVNGRSVCTGEIGPQLETCDCDDNDCDGKIDEDTGSNPVCPGDSVCTMCQCALPCKPSVEFAAVCPQGKAPIVEGDDCFCVGERCRDTTCRRQTIKLDDEVQCTPNSASIGACMCKNNECSFVCSGVQCGDGLVCDPTDGRCRQSSCLLPQFACPSNQRCALVDAIFECVDDPCAFQVCGDDEMCREGNCVKSCARKMCETGQRCVDGECEPDRCADVTCDDNQVCNPSDGKCALKGFCAIVGCPDGTACDKVSGACAEDICLRTQCATDEKCNSETGQCELRCPIDQLFCDSQCINPKSSRLFCGATGKCSGDSIGERCGAGLVCSEGSCSSSCAEGLVNCGGDCIDPVSDAKHCGASDDCNGGNAGQECTSTESCVAGRCRAPSKPGVTMTEPGRSIVAAGGGGCACSVGPGSGTPAGAPLNRPLALLSIGLGLLGICWRRRRRLVHIVQGRANSALLLAFAVASAGLLDSGCKVKGFCLDCTEGDGGSTGPNNNPDPDGGISGGRFDAQVSVPDTGAPIDGDASLPDSGSVMRPDACTSLELCNGVDDDCDGTVDEDADPTASNIDVQTNPSHCGGCGKACTIEHAYNRCVAAKCEIDRAQGTNGCDIGYVDLDGDGTNGCEYRCNKTADDDTACNQVDNDCDGKVDENVDLNTDVANCGLCNLKCQFAHAENGAGCSNKTCVLDDTKCDDGFINADGKAATGCEYRCPVLPTANETCNKLDDDCDGKVDENITTGDDPAIGIDCGTTTGNCELGVTVCTNGQAVCTGGVGMSTELCDNDDNDCDGNTDEGFNTQTDIGNCGSCGNKCLINSNISNGHATLKCQAGTCQVDACIGNFANTNGDYHDGCETACTITGNEVCDNVDNDCNGLVDDNPSTPPEVCLAKETGVCGVSMMVKNQLRASGPKCTNGVLSCDPSAASIPGYEAVESSCDNKDNDCDGKIDEHVPAVGQPCTLGEGACQTTGVNVCMGNTGFTCGAATPSMGTPEVCNGVDDDCNGTVDDFPSPTADLTGFDLVDLGMTHGNVLMMAYEASRSDADSMTAGVRAGRPCSRPNRLPWANVTWGEADAACCALNANGQCMGNNKGWRLCDSATWETACEGQSGTCTWAYSTSMACSHASSSTMYQGTCLGSETSVTCPMGITQCATTTGSSSFTSCKSVINSSDVFDLSGNLKEWTRTPAGTNIYELRGGSYNNLEAGRTCAFDFTVGSTSFRFPNTGFRCCYYP